MNESHSPAPQFIRSASLRRLLLPAISLNRSVWILCSSVAVVCCPPVAVVVVVASSSRVVRPQCRPTPPPRCVSVCKYGACVGFAYVCVCVRVRNVIFLIVYIKYGVRLMGRGEEWKPVTANPFIGTKMRSEFNAHTYTLTTHTRDRVAYQLATTIQWFMTDWYREK